MPKFPCITVALVILALSSPISRACHHAYPICNVVAAVESPATVEGDQLKLSDSAPKFANSLGFDLSEVLKAAKVNPAAAYGLSLLHASKAREGRNMLRGQVAMQQMPHEESIQRMVKQAPLSSVEETFTKLDPDTYLQISWTGTEVDEYSIRIEIETELASTETLIPKGATGPSLFLLVNKQTASVQSLWFE